MNISIQINDFIDQSKFQMVRDHLMYIISYLRIWVCYFAGISNFLTS